MKKWLLKKDQTEKIANKLYFAAVRQARQPFFYLEFGVPDTVDGRFDLIILHVYLFLRPINTLAQNDFNSAESAQARKSAQSLFDTMFADMDRSLREMGVSDIAIGKRVKQMVKAFYGRAVAYDEGLAGSNSALQSALERNLYGTAKPSQNKVVVMADYLRYQADHLATARDREIIEGNLQFVSWSRKTVDP